MSFYYRDYRDLDYRDYSDPYGRDPYYRYIKFRWGHKIPSTKSDHKVFVRSSQNLCLAPMERARRELQNDPQKCIEIRSLSKVMIDSSLRLHRRPKGVLLV